MKVSKKDLILFIQLILFIIPVGFTSIGIIKAVWYTGLCISMGVIYLKNFGKGIFVPHSIIIWFSLYLVAQIIMTYINHGDWLYGILTLVVTDMLILFVEKELQVNAKRFLKILNNVLLFNICIEAILHLFFDINFLMDFACVYVYYGVWATVHLINRWNEHQNDYGIYWISFFLVLITVICPQIGSDGKANYEWTFYIMVLIICLIFSFRRFFYKWGCLITVIWFYIGTFSFNLFFVILQFQERSLFVKFIVEDIMHKNISFSGRTGIWNMALSLAYKKPLTGYGTSFVGLKNSTDTWTNWLSIHGPHNQFIAVLLSGGIITLFFYITYIFFSTQRLFEYKKNPVSVIIIFGLLTIYIELSLTYRNILNCIPLFILFTLSRHIDLIVGDKRNEYKRTY